MAHRDNAANRSLLKRSGHSVSRAYKTEFVSTRPNRFARFGAHGCQSVKKPTVQKNPAISALRHLNPDWSPDYIR